MTLRPHDVHEHGSGSEWPIDRGHDVRLPRRSHQHIVGTVLFGAVGNALATLSGTSE